MRGIIDSSNCRHYPLARDQDQYFSFPFRTTHVSFPSFLAFSIPNPREMSTVVGINDSPLVSWLPVTIKPYKHYYCGVCIGCWALLDRVAASDSTITCTERSPLLDDSHHRFEEGIAGCKQNQPPPPSPTRLPQAFTTMIEPTKVCRNCWRKWPSSHQLQSCGRCSGPQSPIQKFARIRYCNRACQRNDWSRHKSQCFPSETFHKAATRGALFTLSGRSPNEDEMKQLIETLREDIFTPEGFIFPHNIRFRTRDNLVEFEETTVTLVAIAAKSPELFDWICDFFADPISPLRKLSFFSSPNPTAHQLLEILLRRGYGLLPRLWASRHDRPYCGLNKVALMLLNLGFDPNELLRPNVWFAESRRLDTLFLALECGWKGIWQPLEGISETKTISDLSRQTLLHNSSNPQDPHAFNRFALDHRVVRRIRFPKLLAQLLLPQLDEQFLLLVVFGYLSNEIDQWERIPKLKPSNRSRGEGSAKRRRERLKRKSDHVSQTCWQSPWSMPPQVISFDLKTLPMVPDQLPVSLPHRDAISYVEVCLLSDPWSVTDC